MSNKFYIERDIHNQIKGLLLRIKNGKIEHSGELNDINVIHSRMVALGKYVFQENFENDYLELMRYFALFMYKQGHYDKAAKYMVSIEFFRYTHQLKSAFAVVMESFDKDKVLMSISDYKNVGITLENVREWATKKKQYKLIQELEFVYNNDGQKEVYFDLYFKDISLNNFEVGKITDMSEKVNWGLY
ncbi:hypothetical protein [Paenibacillus xylanexedens]|uniref:hypothetical protein n=1 Tax=Paenibacillus xylanexedens TaxID=528191 RepID=UPI000F52EA69|nr:hypothetical protein [Paenibacillus xylanexedens]RPK29385.1 hypothetical protein EDO6_00008 [Paenibacillus xylanexedens]